MHKLALIIITFEVLMIISATNDDFETDLRYIKVCNETSPISLDTLNQVLANKKLETGVTDSANFKCFLHCLFMEYKWMDEDGGFLLHEIKMTLEEAKVELPSLDYILFKCTALQSVDKCERSFKFLQCFWRKNNQMKVQSEEEKLLYYDENDNDLYKKLIN